MAAVCFLVTLTRSRQVDCIEPLPGHQPQYIELTLQSLSYFSESQSLAAGRALRGSVQTEAVQHRGQHGEHRGEAQHRLQPDSRPQGLHWSDPQDTGSTD